MHRDNHVECLVESRQMPHGFARLETLVVLATVALLFQVFPSLWLRIVSTLDLRIWSRGAWVGLNLGVIVGLVGIRYHAALRTKFQLFVASVRSLLAGIETSDRRDNGSSDCNARTRRDAEWRERAKKRMPFT